MKVRIVVRSHRIYAGEGLSRTRSAPERDHRRAAGPAWLFPVQVRLTWPGAPAQALIMAAGISSRSHGHPVSSGLTLESFGLHLPRYLLSPACARRSRARDQKYVGSVIVSRTVIAFVRRWYWNTCSSTDPILLTY